MPDFNVRSDSVNVEQIMEQIRDRIREKRGVDYTEQQIRELADVKLEKFLDPRGIRSDLLDQFRKAQPAYEPPELPNFAFEDATLFESHRAPIRWIRKLLMPLLKLLFNPNPLIQALHIQSRLNTMNAEREARRESARRAMDQLYYELVHNLVVETTRTGIEVKNLKMRIESISSRLEFNERRARALESAVVYRAQESDEAPAQRSAAPVAPSRQQPSVAAVSASVQPADHVRSAGSNRAGAAAISGGDHDDARAAGTGTTAGIRRTWRRSRSTQPQAAPTPRAARRCRGVNAHGRSRFAGARNGGRAGVAETIDQTEALDRMEDDGAPESEEMDETANVPQVPAAAELRRAESAVEHAGDRACQSITR